MKVQIKYKEGVKFVAQARTHQFNIDQPKEKGGSDSGMNPSECFLVSLGGCVAFYARKYCKDTNIDPTGLAVTVDADFSQNRPYRFENIKIKISLNQDLGKRKDSFLRFVKNCPIHNTILGQPNIGIEI